MMGRVSERPEPGAERRRIYQSETQRQCESHGGPLRGCPYCAAIARIRALEEEWSISVNFPAYFAYVDRWAPSDFTYVQGGDGNPFVAVPASTAELAEYCCFRSTVETNKTLYAFRRKPPLFWQSVRSFFWNEEIVVRLSTPATAIAVDEDVEYVFEYASSDSSNIRDMVSVHEYSVTTEEGWEGMETDADADSCGSEGAVIGSSP